LPYDKLKQIIFPLKYQIKIIIQKRLGRQFEIRSPGNTVVNELKFNDSKITSPEKIANAFNTYFTDIGPNLASSIDDTDITFDRFVKPATSKMTRASSL
jgi:hypothetical protein